MSRASSLLFLVPLFALTLVAGCSCENTPVSGRCTAPKIGSSSSIVGTRRPTRSALAIASTSST